MGRVRKRDGIQVKTAKEFSWDVGDVYQEERERLIEARDREIRAATLREAALTVRTQENQYRSDGWVEIADAAGRLRRLIENDADRAERGE